MDHKLDKKWCGELPIKKFAVLYYDEVSIMLHEDPDPWVDPRCVEQARELYECIMGWRPAERTSIYQWLRSPLK